MIWVTHSATGRVELSTGKDNEVKVSKRRCCGRVRLRRRLSAGSLTSACVLSGLLTEDSYDFANSWAVKGADQSCRRVSNPSKSCNSTKGTEAVRLKHGSMYVVCLMTPHIIIRFSLLLKPKFGFMCN